MITLQIGQQIPSVLLGPCEEFLFHRIIVVIGYAGTNCFLISLVGIPECFFEQRPLPARVPVERHRKSRCRRPDKQRHHLSRRRLDEQMKMIVHQREGDDDNPIFV